MATAKLSCPLSNAVVHTRITEKMLGNFAYELTIFNLSSLIKQSRRIAREI